MSNETVSTRIKAADKAVEQGQAKEAKIPCEVYSRIVGYLRPVQNWNKGKKQEFSARRTYRIKEKVVE